MKYILSVLVIGVVAFFFCYALGIGHYLIDEKKGAYWPDMKYGVADIYIWHNADIIYHDTYNYRPEVWEQDHANHLNLAKKFIQEQQ